MSDHHITVLLNEAVDALEINADGIYIDGTFGRGGHSKLILNKLGKKGRLIAFDRDLEAVNYANKNINDDRFIIIHNSFANMELELDRLNLLGKIDGILLDLGVSSPQLDNADRGFSFMRTGPLDMRMDNTSGMSARDWLLTADEKDISDILWKYGEERFSRKIASAIVSGRNLHKNNLKNYLVTSSDLVNLIENVITYREKNKHQATRSFQAIRIKVNDEFGQLYRVLESSKNILSEGGILSVISFHSLEDRIVKKFLQENNKGQQIPKGLIIPDYMWDKQIYFDKILKPIKASDIELKNNVRSRSAILRVARRSSYRLFN